MDNKAKIVASIWRVLLELHDKGDCEYIVTATPRAKPKPRKRKAKAPPKQPT